MKAKLKGNRKCVKGKSVTHPDFEGSNISEGKKGVLGIKLNNLSRCTGFPVAVLRDFIAQGILPRATPKSINNGLFDGHAFLRAVAEVENAR